MWLYIALHDSFASNIVSSTLAENECTLPAAYDWTGQCEGGVRVDRRGKFSRQSNKKGEAYPYYLG